MSVFKLSARKHIDGILGIGLLLPYFFWLVPNLINSDEVSLNMAYTVIITVALLILNAVVVSWFRLIRKINDIEYQVSLLLLSAGLSVATFILGMLTRNFYVAVIGSVICTYLILHMRCSYLKRHL